MIFGEWELTVIDILPGHARYRWRQMVAHGNQKVRRDLSGYAVQIGYMDCRFRNVQIIHNLKEPELARVMRRQEPDLIFFR